MMFSALAFLFIVEYERGSQFYLIFVELEGDNIMSDMQQQQVWEITLMALLLSIVSFWLDDVGRDVIAIFNLPCKAMQIRFRPQILRLTCKTFCKIV